MTVSHTYVTSHHAHTSIRPAARLVGGFCKFGHVSHYMRDVLHWHPVSQRIPFRISVWVWRCHLGSAPSYLREFCCLASGLAELMLISKAVDTSLKVYNYVTGNVYNQGICINPREYTYTLRNVYNQGMCIFHVYLTLTQTLTPTQTTNPNPYQTPTLNFQGIYTYPVYTYTLKCQGIYIFPVYTHSL